MQSRVFRGAVGAAVAYLAAADGNIRAAPTPSPGSSEWVSGPSVAVKADDAVPTVVPGTEDLDPAEATEKPGSPTPVDFGPTVTPHQVKEKEEGGWLQNLFGNLFGDSVSASSDDLMTEKEVGSTWYLLRNGVTNAAGETIELFGDDAAFVEVPLTLGAGPDAEHIEGSVTVESELKFTLIGMNDTAANATSVSASGLPSVAAMPVEYTLTQIIGNSVAVVDGPLLKFEKQGVGSVNFVNADSGVFEPQYVRDLIAASQQNIEGFVPELLYQPINKTATSTVYSCELHGERKTYTWNVTLFANDKFSVVEGVGTSDIDSSENTELIRNIIGTASSVGIAGLGSDEQMIITSSAIQKEVVLHSMAARKSAMRYAADKESFTKSDALSSVSGDVLLTLTEENKDTYRFAVQVVNSYIITAQLNAEGEVKSKGTLVSTQMAVATEQTAAESAIEQLLQGLTKVSISGDHVTLEAGDIQLQFTRSFMVYVAATSNGTAAADQTRRRLQEQQQQDQDTFGTTTSAPASAATSAGTTITTTATAATTASSDTASTAATTSSGTVAIATAAGTTTTVTTTTNTTSAGTTTTATTSTTTPTTAAGVSSASGVTTVVASAASATATPLLASPTPLLGAEQSTTTTPAPTVPTLPNNGHPLKGMQNRCSNSSEPRIYQAVESSYQGGDGTFNSGLQAPVSLSLLYNDSIQGYQVGLYAANYTTFVLSKDDHKISSVQVQENLYNLSTINQVEDKVWGILKNLKDIDVNDEYVKIESQGNEAVAFVLNSVYHVNVTTFFDSEGNQDTLGTLTVPMLVRRSDFDQDNDVNYDFLMYLVDMHQANLKVQQDGRANLNGNVSSTDLARFAPTGRINAARRMLDLLRNTTGIIVTEDGCNMTLIAEKVGNVTLNHAANHYSSLYSMPLLRPTVPYVSFTPVPANDTRLDISGDLHFHNDWKFYMRSNSTLYPTMYVNRTSNNRVTIPQFLSELELTNRIRASYDFVNQYYYGSMSAPLSFTGLSLRGYDGKDDSFAARVFEGLTDGVNVTVLGMSVNGAFEEAAEPLEGSSVFAGAVSIHGESAVELSLGQTSVTVSISAPGAEDSNVTVEAGLAGSAATSEYGRRVENALKSATVLRREEDGTYSLCEVTSSTCVVLQVTVPF